MEANQLFHQQPPAKTLKSEKEQEKVVEFLEERLEKHDSNRKVVQGKLTEILNKLTEQVDSLEERIAKEFGKKFVFEEGRLQAALNELRGDGSASVITLQKVKAELSVVQSYEIIENKKSSNDITTLYELKTERRSIIEDDSVGLAISEVNSSTHDRCNTTEKKKVPCGSDKFSEERERLIELLEERLQTHDDNKKAAQDKLHEICERLRAQIDELEERINKELEGKFTSEDNRFQAALNELRGNRTPSALQKAKAELLVEQLYEVIENKKVKHDLTALYELKTERRIDPELMEMRKPTNVRITDVNRGRISVEFTCFNPDEERVLSDNTIVNPVKYKCLIFKKGNEQESKKYPLGKNEGDNSSSFFIFTPDILEAETTYGIRTKMVFGSVEGAWSDVTEFTTPEFKECCVWKKCPDDFDNSKKYIVDGGNPRVATCINSNICNRCTIIGNTYIPLGIVTSWSVKIHKSEDNNGDNIFIGIAPNNINQNGYYNHRECGWYFYCYDSTLWSGPPHNYSSKEYGSRKGDGQYVHTGDSVGVVVDTTKGDLSFVLNGVNCGVAYEGIPLDKPLLPCVILKHKGDSVELDTSEVKENMDSSVLVPSNITTESTTWNSITLTWDEVEDVSFYQVEVNESKSWDAATTNSFIKRGLFPDTEHSFRVRTVRGSSVGGWSDVVKGRTLKAPEFSECVWKKCPDNVDDKTKYTVDGKNPRIATKISEGMFGDYCTIIGNTHIPLNKVTSWSDKVLKSLNNNGGNIYIGVAPSDIKQHDFKYNSCGWYFSCYKSILRSGPPHSYSDKEYGPRKGNGQYVHTGDSVGVVMDTEKGELSFVLSGVNLGVAYCRIPLDKPLVPCVILYHPGDSVELII